MKLEDYVEPEVGVAVAITAAIASPQVRRVLRKGAVYGLAGLMMAGEKLSRLAGGAAEGVRRTAGRMRERAETSPASSTETPAAAI